MIETDSKLSDLATVFKRYPQACVNVKVASRTPLEELENVNKVIAKIEHELGDSGRVLVRYSGTENLCRVMVEGPKYKQVHQMANLIAATIESEIGRK
jgi:phosphoglucosamine mutase